MVVAPLLFLAAFDAESAALLTSIIASAAANERVEVLTSEDVRRALQFEAEKQSLGCTEAESCLAEISQAMGANVVLYGAAGQLDDVLIVTLQLFDPGAAKSGGRVVVRASSKKELAGNVESQARGLVQSFLATKPGGERIRLLVLDLKADALAPPPEAPAPQPPLLAVVGGGAAALGLVVAGVGGAFDLLVTAPADARTRDKALTQQDANQAFDDRESAAYTALALYGTGAGLVVVGGAIAAFGLFSGGE